MHTTVPTPAVASARYGAPAVLMKLLMPNEMLLNTKPNAMICMNRRAYGSVVSVAPTTRKIGSRQNRATRAMGTASSRTIAIALPSVFSARSFLPSPSMIAASALPPAPAMTLMAIKTVMTGAATVVAARPTSPMAWPRKIVSMML